MVLVQLKQLRASPESFRVSYDKVIQWRAQAAQSTDGRADHRGPSYLGSCAVEGYSKGRFSTSNTNPRIAETLGGTPDVCNGR